MEPQKNRKARAASSAIFDLIKSLTSYEIGYIKLDEKFNLKSNSFVQLFNIIERQKNFDDAAIFKKSGIKGYNNYSSQKNYLYNLILARLRHYHTPQKSIDDVILNDLGNIRLLFEKSLIEQCEKLIRHAKKLSYNYERYWHLPELIEYENKILFFQGKLKEIEYWGEKNCDEAQLVSEYIQEHFEVERIDLKLQKHILFTTVLSSDSLRLQRLKIYDELLNRIQNWGPAIFERQFRSRILKLFIEGFRLEDKLKSEKAAAKDAISKDLHQLYVDFFAETISKQKLALLESYPSQYVSILRNYVRAAHQVGDAERVLALAKVNEAKLTDSDALRGRRYILFFSGMQAALEKQAISEGLQIVKEHLPFLKKEERRKEIPSLLTAYGLASHLYFENMDFEQSERLHNKIIKIGTGRSQLVRVDIISITFILLILTYALLGKKNKLTRLSKRAINFMQLHNLLFAPQIAIINFAVEHVSTKDPMKQKKNWADFILTLEDMKDTEAGANLHSYFPFVKWFKSMLGKIQNEV